VVNNLNRVCEVGGEILSSAPDLFWFWLYGKSSNTPSMLLWNEFIKQVTSGLDFYGSKIFFLSFIRTPPTDYDTVFISPFEASERSKGHFQKTCFVIFDQPLFFKARFSFSLRY
jgi:hypothetical protein